MDILNNINIEEEKNKEKEETEFSAQFTQRKKRKRMMQHQDDNATPECEHEGIATATAKAEGNTKVGGEIPLTPEDGLASKSKTMCTNKPDLKVPRKLVQQRIWFSARGLHFGKDKHENKHERNELTPPPSQGQT